MRISKGNFSIVKDREDQKPPDEIPEMDPDAETGDKEYRGPESTDTPTSAEKAKPFKSETPSKIAKKDIKKTDWGDLSTKAFSRNGSTLSDRAKKVLRDLKTKEPLVNWKKELKKFFDQSFKSVEWVLPNKRLLNSGDMVYGRKYVGEDTLKTIVAAVDTSSSISKEQIKIFVNEIMYLTKNYNGDKTIIIYCSDNIDNVDVIKKGGQPDFTKIASTGGNQNGFIPPFKWVEKNKIKPSIFIYLTDTGGDMPDPNKYGIKKYIKKVMWFVCSSYMYNPPPFGKVLFAPTKAIR